MDDSFTENTFGDLSYTFLEPVPNYLTCIICFGLLKEPVATECCGKMFCGEHSSRTSPVCPACRHNPLSVSRNKGFDSIVKDLKVFCLNDKEGCQWSGHLCFEPTHRVDTCDYQSIPCEKECGVRVARRLMANHLAKECLLREIDCEFCNYKGTAAEVKFHLETCLGYHIACPNGCELQLPRKSLKDHLIACPELPVACPFASAGCEQRMKKRDVTMHIQVSVVEHLSLISAQNVSLQEKLTTIMSDQEASHQAKKDLQDELRRLNCKVVDLSRELEETKKALQGATAQLQTCTQSILRWDSYLGYLPDITAQNLPVIIRYDCVQSDYEDDSTWDSPEFCTSEEGYKLLMCVSPNGLRQAKHHHMSVTFLILCGDDDDDLEWPFEGSVAVEILNQLGDCNHYRRVVEFEKFPMKNKRKPNQDPRDTGSKGWGIWKFISQDRLFTKGDDHHYVVDGTIYFRLTLVSEGYDDASSDSN